MAAVFRRCQLALRADGIMVVVFANKNPDAWGMLVGACPSFARKVRVRSAA